MASIPSVTKKGASFIAEGLTINGNIIGEGDMRVSGNIKGEINLKNGSLTIEQPGFVSGTIRANELKIAGEVEGDIYANIRLEIDKTGKVEGKIFTPVIIVQEGAVLNGEFEVMKK